jgi:hypothetical protein
MKTIVTLMALTCLLGVAAAQTMFTGEGYSSSQLAFFNAPSASTFEPNVEKYWGSYIAGQQNVTGKNAMSNMNIWMNTFPLNFDNTVRVATSSFAADAVAPALSASDINSLFLTRGVTSQFNTYQYWAYPPTNGSLTTSAVSGTPDKDAKGRLLSQNIITTFNI